MWYAYFSAAFFQHHDVEIPPSQLAESPKSFFTAAVWYSMVQICRNVLRLPWWMLTSFHHLQRSCNGQFWHTVFNPCAISRGNVRFARWLSKYVLHAVCDVCAIQTKTSLRTSTGKKRSTLPLELVSLICRLRSAPELGTSFHICWPVCFSAHFSTGSSFLCQFIRTLLLIVSISPSAAAYICRCIFPTLLSIDFMVSVAIQSI